MKIISSKVVGDDDANWVIEYRSKLILKTKWRCTSEVIVQKECLSELMSSCNEGDVRFEGTYKCDWLQIIFYNNRLSIFYLKTLSI